MHRVHPGMQSHCSLLCTQGCGYWSWCGPCRCEHAGRLLHVACRECGSHVAYQSFCVAPQVELVHAVVVAGSDGISALQVQFRSTPRLQRVNLPGSLFNSLIDVAYKIEVCQIKHAHMPDAVHECLCPRSPEGPAGAQSLERHHQASTEHLLPLCCSSPCPRPQGIYPLGSITAVGTTDC
eukprot:scaffold8764_cov21-Tisochrysis_lutea.AAC.3